MEIAEGTLLKAETDGQFDLGRKEKRNTRKPVRADIGGPAVQLKGGCVCSVENVGRKK